MTNFATTMKEEIRRLARKEVKVQTEALAQSNAQNRREIASLKRQVRDLEKKLVFLEGQERRRIKEPAKVEAVANGTRFSAKSVKAQRRRTGLSAADYARLVGVSPLTIYNWERGKSRPRSEQLAALVAIRGLGKREALAKLELLDEE